MKKNMLISVCGGILVLIVAGYFTYHYFFQKSSVPEIQGTTQTQADATKIAADLAKAQATVQSESDKLAFLQGQPNPVAVAESQKTTAEAQASLHEALTNEYEKNFDAVKKTDEFFKNPTSAHPQLTLSVDAGVKTDLETERININAILISWKQLVNRSTDSDASRAQATDNAAKVSAYLNALQSAVTNVSTQNSLLSQSILTSYQNLLDDVSSEVSSSLSAVAAAEDELRRSQADLALQQSIGVPEKIQVQQEVVWKAKTDVVVLQSQLDTALVAPSPSPVASNSPAVSPIPSPIISPVPSGSPSQTPLPSDPGVPISPSPTPSVSPSQSPVPSTTPTSTPTTTPSVSPSPTPSTSPPPQPGKPKLLQY